MNGFNNQLSRTATIKSAASHGQSVPCVFGETVGRHLRVQAKNAIGSSTTVTVEYDDQLFLGEVVTCRPAGEVFALDIKVEQILSGLQSLIALRDALLCDAPANVSRPILNLSPLTQAVA